MFFSVAILLFYQSFVLIFAPKAFILCFKGGETVSVQYEFHRYPDQRFPIIFHRDYMRPYRFPAFFPPDVKVIGVESNRAHWHEGVEILHLLGGSLRIFCNEEMLQVEAGDVVVINSNHIHRMQAYKGDCLYRCLIINREICQIWGYDVDMVRFQPVVRDDRIIELFDRIEEEDREQLSFYKSVVMAACQMLMALLSRQYTIVKPAADAASEKKRALVQRIIGYINHQYGQPVTLESVSAAFGYSRYYLAHIFTEVTGLPMMEYLLQTRMNIAANLLIDGAHSIAEIAEQCGYQAPSSFSAAFRRCYGCSPGEFRRRNQREKG